MQPIPETVQRRFAAFRRREFLALAIGGGLGWLTRSVTAHSSSPVFKIIVHPENPSSHETRAFLTDLFLKRVTRWRDGEHVQPADLHASSGVRERFSKEVLKRSVAAVRSYWQQQIFSGRQVPPPEFDSDAAVMRYVSEHRGGVGYVRGDLELNGVKTIAILR